jgi:stage V sporulation protein G
MDEGVEIKIERIYRLDSNTALKGFADISVAGSFVIKGLRIVSGRKGLFVDMPRQQGKDGKWYNSVFLINEALKEKLADMVLQAYEE